MIRIDAKRPQPTQQQAQAQVAAPPPQPAERTEEPEGQLRASPMARRLARELGVDLAQVKGSGPLGRIQKEDVEAAAKAAPVPLEEYAQQFDDLFSKRNQREGFRHYLDCLLIIASVLADTGHLYQSSGNPKV